MTLTTMIILNIGVAAILVAILAAVMLSPTRLRRHFADGYSHRQLEALRRQPNSEAARGRHPRHQHDTPEPTMRPVHNV